MNKADIFQRLQFPLAESVVNNMTKLDSVQVMRAMAALAVCSGHLFHEVYLFNPSSTIKFLNELPWGMGVDLFFVISGYIMMKTSRNCFGRDGAASGFFLKRLVRIVPSYWFFTTLMLISTLLVPQELNSGVFTLPHTIMSYLFIPHFNPRVEGLLQPILGLGWTLVYEMFFYIVFAICLLRKEKEGLLCAFS
jgi:peptidoglycan/LPS O-acetylase OafA/YrhL